MLHIEQSCCSLNGTKVNKSTFLNPPAKRHVKSKYARECWFSLPNGIGNSKNAQYQFYNTMVVTVVIGKCNTIIEKTHCSCILLNTWKNPVNKCAI